MAPQPAPARKRGRPRKDDVSRAPAKKARLGGEQPADRSWEIPDSDEERQKAKPKKNMTNVYDFPDSDEEAPTPPPNKLKGILTPSKRVKARTKSVAFEDPKAQAAEIFFEDLPSKPVKSAKPVKSVESVKSPNLSVQEGPEEDEEEDDEVCTICSKPDSRSGNQIIFCDNCDLAVHQKCYGIARIPRGDWFCKDCATKEPSKSSQKSGVKGTIKSVPAPAAEVAPEIPNFEQHLRSLQRVLLDRCTGRRRIKLRDLDEAYDKTFQLVEQTVLAGEGNSMLVIGARGCGKTTLVESVLSDLGLEHKDNFHVVRLNGFIHTDDKLALKDIWRQLGKEMDVEDDLIGKTNNYADTLASLLALLSHPSEIAEAEEGITSKSVVFIIDEFDLFATHARQTLLYNLFDIAQARKAPIAVLGLTNRIDVVEGLEKRVKSRFSHRYAYLSLSKTLPAYWGICKQGLIVDDEDAKSEGLDTSLEGFTKFQEYWTKKIDTLYSDQSFKDHLEYHYFSTKSVPAFLDSCVLPLAALSPTNLSLPFAPTPSTGLTIDPPDSKLHLLESLSDLDLSLLISAARLDIVAHTDTVNFAMAYDEYTTLIGRQRVQSATSGMLAMGGGVRVWGRGIAESSWERLVALELLLPTGMGARGGHGGIEGRMWKVDVTLEEIPTAVKLNAIHARWCREI
ncbi:Origin recognition complex subunit 4 [Cytospora mali]|uniref:Origin recognition complex subunit 4 n=1 Tax=Cytospora mali TaxID=578113 RepID=A0A194VA22_CYTMA|nr:Origin recognition complex subunit 4 [Valsa mali var. pyri (nom. inval.)]